MMAAAAANAAAFERVIDAVMSQLYFQELDDTILCDTDPGDPSPAPFRFTDLPVELALRTLGCLSIEEIAQFQRVSKGFKKLVEESSELQYRIECHIAGIVDNNPASTSSFSERLAAVRQWRQAWVDFSYTYTDTLLEDDDLDLGSLDDCLFGTLYAVAVSDTEVGKRCDMILYRLPSAMRGVTEREWTLYNSKGLPEFDIFSCDYDQDLLVLVDGQMHTDNPKIIIHLVSVTTGEPYSVAHPTITIAFPARFKSDTWRMSNISISGAFLSLEARNFFDLRGDDEIEGGRRRMLVLVHDWVTGTKKMMVHNGGSLTNATVLFMGDGGHVILTLQDRQLVNLVVLNLSTCPAELMDLGTAYDHAVLVLGFPAAREGRDYIAMHTQCSPVRHTAADGSRFFRTNTHPVVDIGICVGETATAGGGRNRFLDILIPASTILSRIEDHRYLPQYQRFVPWDKWMAETRLVFAELHGGPTHTRSVCGSRYITAIEDTHDEGRAEVVIYDFDSPQAMLKDVLSPNAGMDVDKRFLLRPLTLPNEPSGRQLDFLENDIETLACAPCRIIHTDIWLEPGQEAGLLEDGIIVADYQPKDASLVRVYTI